MTKEEIKEMKRELEQCYKAQSDALASGLLAGFCAGCVIITVIVLSII